MPRLMHEPKPSWDEHYPCIPYCDRQCPYYDVDIDRHGYPESECAITRSADGELPHLPELCEECAVCLPALALGMRGAQ